MFLRTKHKRFLARFLLIIYLIINLAAAIAYVTQPKTEDALKEEPVEQEHVMGMVVPNQTFIVGNALLEHLVQTNGDDECLSIQEEEQQNESIVTEIEKPVTNYIDLTEIEKYHFATLIWLEARGESIECQYAVASVVINRLTCCQKGYSNNKYEDILDVIYAKNQFSPAHLITRNEPDQTQIDIVEEICKNGPTIPEYITYFRADYYHKWNNLKSWDYYDNTYFSYDVNIYRKWKEKQ